MRRFNALLTLLALILPASAGASTLNKCIDAKGQVTYSNLPCRNAREIHTVEIDPAPPPEAARPRDNQRVPAPASAPQKSTRSIAKPALKAEEPATLQLETRKTNGPSAKPASPHQCDTLTEKIGRVFDKMDQARRKGYTQEQMNQWNEEVKELERQKQQHGCF